MTEIQILVDSGTVCFAGQPLTGRVKCTFSKEKKLRGVRLRFTGKCETSWDRYKNKFPLTEYSAVEIYFDNEHVLAGDGRQFTLSAGTHTYPFSYQLPRLLPSYFAHTWGRVIYTLKATVDCPWKFNDHATIILRLISPLRLNFFRRLLQPAQVSVDEAMFSWCLNHKNSGPVSFKMRLPLSVYKPGQQVEVTSSIQNLSHVNVEKVTFKIVELMEFIVRYPETSRKYVTTVIVSHAEEGVEANDEKSWTSNLTVPTNILFPNLVHCKLINVVYKLQAELVVPFPHKNLRASLPLMIGQMLNGDSRDRLVQTSLNRSSPSAPPSPNAPPFQSAPPSPSAPPLPATNASAPPTYEETQLAVPAPPTYEEIQLAALRSVQSESQGKSDIDDS